MNSGFKNKKDRLESGRKHEKNYDVDEEHIDGFRWDEWGSHRDCQRDGAYRDGKLLNHTSEWAKDCGLQKKRDKQKSLEKRRDIQKKVSKFKGK